MYEAEPNQNDVTLEGWYDFLIFRYHRTMLSDLAILLQKTAFHEGGKPLKRIF